MILFNRIHIRDDRLYRCLAKWGNRAGWLTVAAAFAIMVLHVAPQVLGISEGWR